jgi:cell volume regulation protein A
LVRIPPAAFLLVAAAVLSDVLPALEPSIGVVEWIATVALVVILFDGGASIGWRRFRAAAAPIASLGVPGTFATAGIVACGCHWVLGLDWTTAGLVGAAIAPTDPAVMFSVLRGRELPGRARTVLEGESGANDPVGIALMLGLIELATHADKTFWVVVRVFTLQMVVGLAVGIAGGFALRRLPMPLTIPLVAATFALAAVAGGSGFLAVFVAGVVAGDVRPPFEQERLSTLGEITVFVALGLTVGITDISATRWLEGLGLAVFLTLVARPVSVRALLSATTLDADEKRLVTWGGLKGAVPILLASFAVSHHVDNATRIYETVFVVVLASVVVQGAWLSKAATRLAARSA